MTPEILSFRVASQKNYESLQNTQSASERHLTNLQLKASPNLNNNHSHKT
jgi:hypothetical protein